MRESSCDRIPITETRASTFRLLLQYIYTGKLNMRGDELLQNSQQQQHVDALIDLLGCAHKYGFVSLQHAVSDYLESILDVKNVCAIYDIAALYALDKLERTCVRFIDRNCVTLIRSQALLSLSQSSLAQILARDSFCAPELEIFHVVKRWHEVNKYVYLKVEI
jgi:BTB/POZ domain-containing protein 9